jgi:O-antigen/teichoic acid export membrane protein
MVVSKIKIWIARTSLISIAPTVEFGTRFARTVILSRLLGGDEFGICVAITVMLGTASLVTDVAIDKFAVIEANESGGEALAAAHMLSLIRGGLLLLVLVVAAPATAALFNVSQYAGSFALAGLTPFISSFVHLEIKQVQRHYDYAPETWSLVLSNVAGVCTLLAAISIFGDHRAIVASFLMESAVYVFVSHLLAQTPYRLKVNRAMIRKALAFGIPLMFNGLGLALLSQFDRALVGRWFGVDMLAKYSVWLSISVVPISLVLRVFGTLSLSFILSHVSKGDPSSGYYRSLVFFFAVLAALYSLLVALTLDWAAPAIFGPSFEVDPGVHLLLTAIVFFRLQRGGAPTCLLLAMGRTRELAILNLCGGIGLGLAIAFLYWSPRFEMLLLGLMIGDIICLSLFYFVSSTVVKTDKSHLTADLGMAIIVLAIILGMLTCYPEFDLARRVVLLGVGVTAVGVQIALGFWIQRT